MANFFIKTARQLRQPIACFGIVAASCFPTTALGDDNEVSQQSATKLEQLFSQKEIQFSPVPPLADRIHQTASSSDLRSANGGSMSTAMPVAPQGDGPSASEFLSNARSPAQALDDISARVVMPVERISEAELWSRRAADAQLSGITVNRTSTVRGDMATGQSATQPVSTRAAAGSTQTNDDGVRPVKRTHQLRNVSTYEFENALIRNFAGGLQSQASSDGRYIRVAFQANQSPQAGGLAAGHVETLQMLIDRQTGVLIYEGNPVGGSHWSRLMGQLDLAQAPTAPTLRQAAPQAKTQPASAATSIVAELNPSQLNTIKQATFMLGLQDPQIDDDLPIGQERQALPPGSELSGLQGELPPGTQGIKGTVKFVTDANGQTIIIGSPEDLKIVKEMIAKISERASQSQPVVDRIQLQNLQSEAIAERVQELYDESYAGSSGPAKVEPLAASNSLVVVGQPEAIEAIKQIVGGMDVETDISAAPGFKAFRLKHISAVDAKLRLDTYFAQRDLGQGDNRLPSAPVITISDYRSNTLLVKGSVQFIQEAEVLLQSLDIAGSEEGAVNQVRIFPLRNAEATNLAIVIQDAINGQQRNAGAGFTGNQNAANQNNQNNVQADANTSQLKATSLSMSTIDASGSEVVGGIMFDVRVTADFNSNSLVVTGPKESMPLVAELVRQLDRIPDAETQLKVFTIVNSDATTLLTTLNELFGGAAQQGGGNAQGGGVQGQNNLSQLPLQSSSSSDGQTLVNLRFSVDTYTNSIIAAGPAGDLMVIEDLLNRLDEARGNDREANVYRLSNAPAVDVADAINEWAEARGDIITNDPRQEGINQVRPAIVVIPQEFSNSLVVSATAEYLPEVERIIRALDRQPAQVKVKVLLAEVDLSTLEEFGIELGLQDSLLFDRGTSLTAGGGINGIGFPFNNNSVANANAISPGNLAGQVLSNLNVGRSNSSLGYGGLVLSAGSESVNILLRALQDRQSIRVLNAPTIETQENLTGRTISGALVPRVGGTTATNFGITQDVTDVEVGVILQVTPRVSPDGLIVMAVDASKRSVGPDETGITIAIGADGSPIRSPQILTVEAQTTLAARHGQTVVFSGLITEENVHTERGAPILSDLPLIGPLFKFESDSARRTELLIMLTPYLVTNGEEQDAVNQIDFDRMHWCEQDVAEIFGNVGSQNVTGFENRGEVIYPDAGSNAIEAPQPQYESYPPQSNARQSGNVRPVSYERPNRR